MASDERTQAGVRLIHLDAVGGVAGDIFVAAMLDAFPWLRDRVFADIAAVLPADCGTPALDAGHSGGVRALRFRLETNQPHRHEHPAADAHGTSFAALRARIEGAGLSEGTAEEAVAILTILAEAEARIHGVGIEEVHFHEVGDWDSLMDVVAAGSIAAALRPARWTVSDLPRGGGLVRTQHGMLPVPAPATIEILSGFRWRDDGIAGERVTPTGAAILRHLCQSSSAGAGPSGTLAAAGTGAGTRELDGMPNILRVTAFADADRATQETVDILSFDIDDMTGEEIAVSAERLRGLPGVVSLSFHTVAGKKGRPLCRFEIMARAGNTEALARAVFTETSTLGLRWRSEQRMTLTREHKLRAGRRVKTAARPGGQTTKVESDELAGIEGLAQRRAVARAAETEDPSDE